MTTPNNLIRQNAFAVAALAIQQHSGRDYGTVESALETMLVAEHMLRQMIAENARDHPQPPAVHNIPAYFPGARQAQPAPMMPKLGTPYAPGPRQAQPMPPAPPPMPPQPRAPVFDRDRKVVKQWKGMQGANPPSKPGGCPTLWHGWKWGGDGFPVEIDDVDGVIE